MKVLIVVQARMTSTRLPGKVLMPVLGKSLLFRQIERMRRSKYNNIVVAMPDEKADDPIEKECIKYGIDVFRGHPTDLLDRHYNAGVEYGAGYIVKIPSDCPLIDPAVIDNVIEYFIENISKYDYVSNLHPPTYPDGNDVEIMPMTVLEEAWRNADKDFELEHTTPYIWERPDKYRIGNYFWEKGRNYSMSHRFTIDYPEDLDFIRKVYEELYPSNPEFTLLDILTLLERKPEIHAINAKYLGVNWYRNHMNELKTIDNSQTKSIENERI